MLVVTHEKVIRETFGLIELDLYFKRHRFMLQVPSDTTEVEANRLWKLASEALSDTFPRRQT